MTIELRQNKTSPLFLLAGIVISLSACTHHKVMYDWGEYPQISYNSMQQEGDPQQVISSMEEHLIKTKGDGADVPPGYHAQLGMLYAQIGNDERMRAEFRTESTLFPEAKPYMEFLLSQQRGGALQKNATNKEKTNE